MTLSSLVHEPDPPSEGVPPEEAREEDEPETIKIVKSSKLFKDYAMPHLRFPDPDYFKTTDTDLHKVSVPGRSIRLLFFFIFYLFFFL